MSVRTKRILTAVAVIILAVAAILIYAFGVKGVEGGTEDGNETVVGTCILTIDCSAVLSGKYSEIVETAMGGKYENLPKQPVVSALDLYRNNTALGILERYAEEAVYEISVRSGYVESIFGLSEKMAASTSGWVYEVNGNKVTVGGAAYKLKDGDKVLWKYVI